MNPERPGAKVRAHLKKGGIATSVSVHDALTAGVGVAGGLDLDAVRAPNPQIAERRSARRERA